MLPNARSVCVFISVCSIVWVLFTGFGFSFDRFLLIATSLSTLYFFNVCIVSAEVQCEPPEKILLRKQIQACNWKILYNRAAYLAHMREVFRRNKPNVIKTRLHSDTYATRPNPDISGARRWKSWSDSMDPLIPDFHASHCRNNEAQRTLSF